MTIYQGVTLGGTGFATGKRHPTVEDSVTIGSGAKLLGPIVVGHGAKIGANTVVIHDVPPNSTVVGIPGHPVRVEGRRPEGPDADWVHLPDPIADAIKALRGGSRRSSAADRRGGSQREAGGRQSVPAENHTRADGGSTVRSQSDRGESTLTLRVEVRGCLLIGGARAGVSCEVAAAAHEVQRPALDLVEDAADVLADQADRDQLDAAEQQHRDLHGAEAER